MILMLFNEILQIIEEQLHKCGYKRDLDVSELYLGRTGLKEVTDLSRFRMLKFLWLNHNKITRITCLANNWRLSELYLNNNEICDITGCLKHLTSLHTLLLNNNRLANLQATATELKGMTNLQVLKVVQKERDNAFKIFNPERTAVIQSLGFGRRTDSVLAMKSASKSSLRKSAQSSGNQGSVYSKPPDALEALLLRTNQRSVVQFSLVDWTKIPSAKQTNKSRTEEQSLDKPQLLTVEFQ
ncbi:leucine-rich repeat-containing protein 72 isoform X4 [Xenopus laevis]|uniref:Leucine-rich repeat-containing protein 72 isoform X4 n=1 Tax=Xenopus laevis TaxID=8355 RepID=A0A8J1KX34_XENLA|nr:leucine-rich repeat-containing protein 72 isoform X4 [Xenopus laevis]